MAESLQKERKRGVGEERREKREKFKKEFGTKREIENREGKSEREKSILKEIA